MTAVLMIIRQNWKAIGIALVLLVLSVTCYRAGISHGTDATAARYEARLAERDRVAAQAMAEAVEKANAQAAAAQAIERQHLAKQRATEQQFQTITRTVTEYVEKHPDLTGCGLDADGLRYWNAGNRGFADDRPGNP